MAARKGWFRIVVVAVACLALLGASLAAAPEARPRAQGQEQASGMGQVWLWRRGCRKVQLDRGGAHLHEGKGNSEGLRRQNL